jgi:hypothetical protein
MPMVHICNPSYSGGRDQEDQGSKLAQANSSRDSISENTQYKKRAGRVAQVVEPLPIKHEGPPPPKKEKYQTPNSVFQK